MQGGVFVNIGVANNAVKRYGCSLFEPWLVCVMLRVDSGLAYMALSLGGSVSAENRSIRS